MRSPRMATARAFARNLYLSVALRTHARITLIETDRVDSSTFEAANFSKTGSYGGLVGRVYGELDPEHEANREVILLDEAPRNAAGWVKHSFDIFILGEKWGRPPFHYRVW